ncbi:MAG: hypothetical protein HRF50_01755 [Phycisphaerae bacterium]|jgi:hypothetical protein
MVEVLSGSRPGRRTVATVLCAAAVAGALALAAFQVQQRRGLVDELRIPGTPLIVRVPRNWTASETAPGVFELRTGTDGRTDVVQRRIAFRYERFPAFRPLEQLLTEMYGVRGRVAASPRKIGPLPAVQAQLAEALVIRGVRFARERVVVVGCSPRGDVIGLEYQPLTELTPSDYELLDAICAALRLDDAALTLSADEAMARAGLHFTPARDWTVFGPDFERVAGLSIEALSEGIPAWSILVSRTWLADGRTPAALLADFAATHWDVQDGGAPSIHEAGSRQIATIRHPGFGHEEALYPSVWLVSDGPTLAAMLLVCAAPDRVAVADQAASDLARALRFTDTELGVDVREATQAARNWVATSLARGAAPWWGKLRHRATYTVRSVAGVMDGHLEREAVGDEPARGYVGSERFTRVDSSESRKSEWSVDGTGRGYSYSFESLAVRGRHTVRTTVREQRRAGSDRVDRTVLDGRTEHSSSFVAGDAFVCPPLESIAEFWVAQQSGGNWLFQVSSVHAAGSHARLLRPLAPEAGGRVRVLAVDDFFPRGALLSYDESAQLVQQIDPYVRIDRRNN